MLSFSLSGYGKLFQQGADVLLDLSFLLVGQTEPRDEQRYVLAACVGDSRSHV
jgi:hypothetical protein